MSSKQLQIDLTDLPRQAGSRLEVERVWEVPAGWSTEVLKLPEGTKIPLEVDVTAIDDGVYAQVRAEGTLVGECVRCLDPIMVPWRAAGAEVYFEPERAGAGRTRREDDGIEAEGDDLDRVLQIERDSIDLEPLLRDEILSAAPLMPVCSEDCLGLCEHCGERLADLEPDHSHEFLDPRFAALEGFFSGGNGDAE